MKTFFKKIYKSLIYFISKIFYGEIDLNRKFIKRKKIKSNLFGKNSNYYFYELENIRVYTDGHENVSLIRDKKLLDHVSYQQINGRIVDNKFNQVLKTGTPKLLKKFNGKTIMLAQGASGYSNYSHWLFDILPRIKLFSLAYKMKTDFIYLTSPNKFQRETLKILGFGNLKFINSKKYRHILCEKLFFCTHPVYNKGTIMEAQSKIPVWIIKYIKKKFNFLINKNRKEKIKIFIDRSDSTYSHCKLINNEEIKKHLIDKGFKILKLSKLSFKEQINKFNNASIVIGPHGAGFANLIFCKKKTKIVEIRPTTNPNKVYERISQINNLSYKLIKLPTIKHDLNGDMILNKKILDKNI